MTLGMPPLGLTIQGPMGFLKASFNPINFSLRFRHLSSLWKKYLIYHITYSQKLFKLYSNFFQTLFKQKHLLIVSGNACILEQNTQCLQLKDSIIFFKHLLIVSGNACILEQN